MIKSAEDFFADGLAIRVFKFLGMEEKKNPTYNTTSMNISINLREERGDVEDALNKLYNAGLVEYYMGYVHMSLGGHKAYKALSDFEKALTEVR